MAPTQFQIAESDREAIRDQINLLQSAVDDHNGGAALQKVEVETYLEEANELRKILADNHKRIRSTASSGTDLTGHQADFTALTKQGVRIHAALHGILMTFPADATPATAPPTSTTSASHYRLPRLDIPKFAGSLQEWVSFRDLFDTAINKSSLSKVEKLTQLKGLLTGEAARLVRHLLISEANFDIAWDALRNRYENNREFLFSVLKRLISQPPLTTGTASGLRSLIDTHRECISSLQVISMPTQHWDAITLYLLFTKLDPVSRELWEQTLPDTSVPSLKKLEEFVEQRARALAAGGAVPPRPQSKGPQPPAKSHHSATTRCRMGCHQPHPLFRCQEFYEKTPTQRLDFVKRNRLCINCFCEGHHAAACPSKHNCKTCHRRHNSMLHLDSVGGKQQQPPPPTENTEFVRTPHQPTSSFHHATMENIVSTGILATALISLQGSTGSSNHRALIDGGSTNTQIMKRTAKRLNLQLRTVNIPMSGPGGVDCGTCKHVTTIKFTPHFNKNVVLSATALVVDKVTGHIPTTMLQTEEWTHLYGLQYADPAYNKPDEVEILLGTDVVWSILENDKKIGQDGQPIGIKTTLGWLVAGPNGVRTTSFSSFNSVADLDWQLRKFWEQEEVTSENLKTKEERECEAIFAETHARDKATGRFTVMLPLKSPQPPLGSSRQQAVQRFLSLERKHNNMQRIKDGDQLKKLQQQWDLYKDFMKEYEVLQHMEVVPVEEVDAPDCYYIPHHAVFKDSSTTTKLRVVFDASASTSLGNSLNDTMLNGPQLQESIWEIMLRFRLHPIAFTADIAKMYRQIRVHQRHTNLQRIVWRDHPSKPLKDYRLLTVTYGTTSAPYLAVKCLQQLAMDECRRYPVAAKVALRDFYVDDVASSVRTPEEAITTVQQLNDLCMSGGFELRKWTTNSPELLATIPYSIRESSSTIELQQDSTIKTLGIFWNPREDRYNFKITLPPDMPGTLTKRSILSEIAKIFDPLGWVAPAIITCKIFMQELWKLKHDWDDIVPSSVEEKWVYVRDSLFGLEDILIPRCVIPSSPVKLYLVGCSDASTRAISAVVYIAAEYAHLPPSCHLLTSKTRVAPVKPVTLPRLELNGAVLLSELLHATIKCLQLKFDDVRAFCDSTITLHWINSSPAKWKVYVRNRVQTIHDNLPNAKWFHIAGERNPADCASRGITSADLQHHPLWWNGVPEFFTADSSTADLMETDAVLMEKEADQKGHHSQSSPLPPFLLKYSSFGKLQRVMAYVQRFVFNCRYKDQRLTEGLKVEELVRTHTTLIQLLQQFGFPLEITVLSKGQSLPSNSSMLKLQPFISQDGLLRVGGRLRNADLPFSRKHPILLPRGHHLTNCIIRDAHESNFHAGATATLNFLQQRYWITSGRDSVRAIIRKCVTCTRHRGEVLQQIMGDLPPHRINQCRPFSKVGVDYAGPFSIKPLVRSRVGLKCWLSIFVCFITRAIHIEVATSLSADCFLAALKRFISRRGKPSDIFSDCGTNFKGASKALDNCLLAGVRTTSEVTSQLGINWHFNPPGAPHFGGLWEAGVKSIKHHLTRVMGASTLTYEEMLSLVVQIEGVLNSRPIVPRSADPADLEALTPAHFLIGAPITAAPEPEYEDVKLGYNQRWQLLQQQQQMFWRRWSREYLTRLQQRPKWMKISTELQPGQMVIVKEERLPPLKWKLARVVAVHPGKDGHVRVATVKTADGEVQRPIVKLSLLPISP